MVRERPGWLENALDGWRTPWMVGAVQTHRESRDIVLKVMASLGQLWCRCDGPGVAWMDVDNTTNTA